jgi:hypothetical protein
VDPEVILTTRIACARIRGASSVRRVGVAELLGSVGCRKIGGDQWYPQNKKMMATMYGTAVLGSCRPQIRNFAGSSQNLVRGSTYRPRNSIA